MHAFGAVLLDGMKRAELTYGKVELRLRARSAWIGRSELVQLQKGRRWRVDALVLRGLADIYGLPHQWLLEALRWNRQHPDEQTLPASLPKEEAAMRVTGHEEGFVLRFRRLNAAQQRSFYRALDAIELDKTGGAPEKGGTFR